jgi:hypothetical protein
LENIFAQLDIEQKLPIHGTAIDQPGVLSTSEDRAMELHPGSPLSPIQNSLSISVS